MSETPQPGLRERIAEALRVRLSRVHAPGGVLEPEQLVDYIGATEYELADALLPVVARYCEQLAAGRETWRGKALEIEQVRDRLAIERDQYRAASRHLALRIRQTAHAWITQLPDTIRTAAAVDALLSIASHVPDQPELRDDLWQRIAGAYEARFENDGHPEDARAAADEAMSVVQPEMDELRADRDRLAAEVEELLAELGGRDEEARERWIQKQLAETGIRAVDFRNGMEMELEPARELLAYQVAAARAMLGDAPNYTETKLSWDVKVAESPEMYTIVIQRHAPGVLTPHEARQKAEARAEAAEALLARVREYVATSDDDGVRTRETILGIVGELPDSALDGVEQASAGGPAAGCIYRGIRYYCGDDGCPCVPIRNGRGDLPDGRGPLAALDGSGECAVCGHLTCTGRGPCGVVSTERGELDSPCQCTGAAIDGTGEAPRA